ncbi:ATP-binding protein [Roseovarius aestuarii]|uniref:Serine-protein kinase RsbW n=1 Tax=Roseovarius aestuarii TaxID=475083 RepID=A0A1X7BV45_9RHOB|nr:ATP-binding protein [Roseovarius aestuarii]SMC13531.1 serine-protein kinase RsbW [Roseovarius aestuarii]
MNDTTHTRFQQRFTMSALACSREVRVLLQRMRKRLAELGVSDAVCASVELVLAEALNNITEHAYAGEAGGSLNICAEISPVALRFTLTDRGQILPGIRLPSGNLPSCDVPLLDLPEGGFGWFLIRGMTTSVTYEREDGENRLVLTLPNALGI